MPAFFQLPQRCVIISTIAEIDNGVPIRIREFGQAFIEFPAEAAGQDDIVFENQALGIAARQEFLPDADMLHRT